jgi:hypothetical protein
MREMIQRLDPRVAAISTTSGGPAQPMRVTNFHRFLPYYSDIGMRALSKLSEKAFGRGLPSKSAAPHPRIIAARQACLSSIRNGTNGRSICGPMRSASLYHKQRLDAMLRRAHEPQFQEAEMLGRILTVELALRVADASLDE